MRSSPYHLAGNRSAAHPVNAILNYAYAALESEIRIKAISDGYDPTIGIMHEGSDGSSKFIFDLVELSGLGSIKRRSILSRAGFQSGRFDHSQRRRLNPEIARVVVANVTTWKVNDARVESASSGRCGLR